ncbi:MAG: DNA methyltransferase [Planctomycetaceae bacterium]
MTQQRSTANSTTLPARKPRRHCNELDGKQWLRNSISVWSDIRKSREEAKLGHPALFPRMLVQRLIETFLPPEGELILDPFAGSGSTVITAHEMGKTGIGLELSPEYAQLANERLQEKSTSVSQSVVHNDSSHRLADYLEENSIDLCITSPPYWNILNQRRTADHKTIRNYGNLEGDLGTIESYQEFLQATTDILQAVHTRLKPGAYCCVIVMDLRKKSRFFPLHSDLATRLVEVGYVFDDLIIWNRQSEYNNLRPLGYPSVFRINKVHEYILLMQKPKT